MAKSRISIAKSDIVHFFDEDGRKIYRLKELARIVDEHREFWRLAVSMSVSKFILYLVSNSKLRKVSFKLPHRSETRYVWGDVSHYKLAASMKPKGYLSHYSALYLHHLTEQVPKTIYVNHEQRPHAPSAEGLAQERIDAAFKRPQRMTKNLTEYDGFRFCYINGMHTGRLGVVELEDNLGDAVHVTGIERTLIDCTVRPMYAGGISEVLGAYRKARDKISLNKLSATLKKMNYMYPYERAIGFYLERSGYATEKIRRHRLFKPPMDDLKFYLVHGMKDPEYDSEWRLFIPKGF